MKDRDEELAELLRAALEHEASRVRPAGDGLRRIQDAVAGRRTRFPVRRAITVAAAVLVVAAAAVVPVVLRGSGSSNTPVANGGSGAQTLGSEDATSTAPGLPSPGQTPGTTAMPDHATMEPGPGDLPNMATVWPYPSRADAQARADGDVTTGVEPDLTDPGAAAVRFVESFVGSDDRLQPGRTVPLEQGIGVTVNRRTDDEGLTPVTLVYLVPVREGEDAPYVVAEARSPSGSTDPTEALRVDPGTPDGVDPVAVAGTMPGIEAPLVASVKVELREPGNDETIASMAVPITDQPKTTAAVSPWNVTLAPVRELNTMTGTVAAWLVDRNNRLIDFVAVPTR